MRIPDIHRELMDSQNISAVLIIDVDNYFYNLETMQRKIGIYH